MANGNRLIPCFLCGNGLQVSNSKKNKPYFVCDPCGLQVFIRKDKGIKAFDEIVGSLQGKVISNESDQSHSHEIIGLINKLNYLKYKREELDESTTAIGRVFDSDDTYEIAVNALDKEIRAVTKRLKKLG